MKRFSLFVPALVIAGALSATAGTVLTGNYLQVGVGGDGSLIDDGFVTGIKWDVTGMGNFAGKPDFLKPGTPWEMYSFNIGGVALPAAFYGAGNPYGFVSTDTSGAGKYQVVTQGKIAGTPLVYTSTVSFGQKSDHINVTTTLANTSASTAVTDIYFARGCDPDQDIDVGGGFATHNVVSGNTATAFSILNAFGNGTPFITVWDLENKGVVGTWDMWGPAGNNDAKALFQTPGGSGDADWEIYAAFYKASLSPAESVTWQFDYIVPEPSQYAMLAGLGLVGFAAYRRFKKA